MDFQAVRNLSDGRILTAMQALEDGLIDDVGSWDNALLRFEGITGVKAYYPNLLTEVTFWGQMFAQTQSILPENNIDFTISRFSDLPTGIPLAIAQELIK